MVIRHFAYFSQETGACLCESSGPVPEPRIPSWLPASVRAWALNRWATRVSKPRQGVVALDVTQFGYPVGDFAWAHFDVIDRRLTWPTMHSFLQVDRETLAIAAHHQSGRPIGDSPHLIADVTGTPLEPLFWDIWGRFLPDGRFEPDDRVPIDKRPTVAALMTAASPRLLPEPGFDHGWPYWPKERSA